jgi:hypothetical protein
MYFDFLEVANQEAFLIYILAIIRLYVVLIHLLPQDNKVLLVWGLRVSLIPWEVKIIKVSIVKDILIPSSECLGPVLSRLLTR